MVVAAHVVLVGGYTLLGNCPVLREYCIPKHYPVSVFAALITYVEKLSISDSILVLHYRHFIAWHTGVSYHAKTKRHQNV